LLPAATTLVSLTSMAAGILTPVPGPGSQAVAKVFLAGR
jgi:hypothetical protein